MAKHKMQVIYNGMGVKP